MDFLWQNFWGSFTRISLKIDGRREMEDKKMVRYNLWQE